MFVFSEIDFDGCLVSKVNIGSGNGLVPPGNKPLPEAVLVKICSTVCNLQGPMG